MSILSISATSNRVPGNSRTLAKILRFISTPFRQRHTVTPMETALPSSSIMLASLAFADSPVPSSRAGRLSASWHCTEGGQLIARWSVE